MGRENLGEFELIVLLAVLRLGENAYGVPIGKEIEKRTERRVTIGALYATLDRLEAKGLLASRFGEPTAERGGRSKRFFRVEADGLAAMSRARTSLESMWRGINWKEEPHA